MKTLRFASLGAATLAVLSLLTRAAPPLTEAERKQIPKPLKAWEAWATWDDKDRFCPTTYSDAQKHLCFWPSRLGLHAAAAGGKFELTVTVFHETWVPLPGDRNVWPFDVKVNGEAVAVVEHEGAPSLKLQAGTVQLEGAFRWSAIPQRIMLPKQIGLLALTIDGQPVEAPVWDAQGLWLKRDGSTEEADKNFLAVKFYSVLDDGIPLWLRSDIELTVAGKSREEEFGNVLPEGWKLAAVDSLIPVAIDDAGRMKAQVRAGKWIVHTEAFRFDNPKEIRFAAGAKPAVAEVLVAFRAKPDFRTIEITGVPSIDVSQTSFPDKWRDLPVYRWETPNALRIEERMRGMGEQKTAGLKINRELWLDENGRGLTFHDRISGAMQKIWRLDAAAGEDLGSVRAGGQGQLITRNPQNGASGVEIRTRELDLEATGRLPRAGALSATGWRADADELHGTLHLPPGWRLFAMFGVDSVEGDWLTAWTLLDLFLLLIFTLAVYRLWGFGAALLAFFAFGLSFHEPFAPRYLWLVLLVPLALQRVVPQGRGARVIRVGKWIALSLFVLALVPFVARQVQQALYPQLEIVSTGGRADAFGFVRGAQTAREEPDFQEGGMFAPTEPVPDQAFPVTPTTPIDYSRLPGVSESRQKVSKFSKDGNLKYDTKARIQTGPGVPEWKWRAISFGWNGPVAASQRVTPVLIPLALERVITVLRVALLLALAAVLLTGRKLRWPPFRIPRKGVALLAFACTLASAAAQAPSDAALDKLRARLLEVPDAFPTAADIPFVMLTLHDRKVTLEAEIHAALAVAVPLPGRLPAWSPLTVLIDDQPATALRRDDGYLWVLIEAGVHRVHVEGSLASVTEWEWTFLLPPRQVKIDAPDWLVTGVRPTGVPEAQVFFARKQKTAAGAASYDRQELQAIAQIDRSLELGLIWQVRNTVTRLSPPGKAVALRVPLLPGENVLSSNAIVRDGFIEVRLGAQEQSFQWESGLAIVPALKLATRAQDAWVERWRLVASPVWNVGLSGLPPVFEPGSPELVPVWQPWPGETVELAISRPEALAGATVTVDRAHHDVKLGWRQRTSTLALSLRCSLGEDFLVELPAEAEITSLTQNGKALPVRKDGRKLIIPLRPGEQKIVIAWKTNLPLGLLAQAGEVRLPVESANIQTVLHVPENRWVLGVAGPQRGPAVRFWGILICSLLAAVALGRLPNSPLRAREWMLLAIGLTQVPLLAALTVVAWLFLLRWRGGEAFQRRGWPTYDLIQLLLIVLTGVSLAVLITAVGEGLLGHPEMFITGNGSARTLLRWFQARSDGLLPRPGFVSISIWWYRFAMLAWALWLAAALLRWLRRGWQDFSRGGFFRPRPKPPVVPPPAATAGSTAMPPPLHPPAASS
jgi:hypothetical protein